MECSWNGQFLKRYCGVQKYFWLENKNLLLSLDVINSDDNFLSTLQDLKIPKYSKTKQEKPFSRSLLCEKIIIFIKLFFEVTHKTVNSLYSFLDMILSRKSQQNKPGE